MTEFDINMVKIQYITGKMFGNDDHLDISRVFEISKFEMVGLACVSGQC